MKTITQSLPFPRPKAHKDTVVVEGRWRARRSRGGQFVYGFLIVNLEGKIQGILNENTRYEQETRGDEDPDYAELAWIDQDTIEKWADDAPAEFFTGEELAEYRKTHPEAVVTDDPSGYAE